MTAKQAKELSDKAIEYLTNIYISELFIAQITDAASRGEFKTTINIGVSEKEEPIVSNVLSDLVGNGYTVDSDTTLNRVTISWDNPTK